mgnify:CR=1 FL=1
MEIGKVTHISVPVPKYGTNSMYNDLILDITAEIDGKTTNFQKLPANSIYQELKFYTNKFITAIDKT